MGKRRTERLWHPRYRCVHCGKVVMRASTKRWVKSWCEATGREVHLQRVRSDSD